MRKSPDQLALIVERLARDGAPVGAHFDSCLSGTTNGAGAVDPAAYEAAGLTWWLECLSPSFGDKSEMLARVRAGPPR